MWFLSRCQDLIGSLASTHSTFNLIGSCNKHPNIQSYKVTKLQRYKATKIHTLTPLTYELFFQNSSKTIGLWSKQQLCICITLFSTFLWRPLHDYDMKRLNLTFYGGRGQTKTKFPNSSFWTWIKSLTIQLKEKSPAFDTLSGSK